MLATGDNVPSVLGDLRVASKPKRELEYLELRAQGAQIRGLVEGIDSPIAKAYLIAYYLPRPVWEKQPGRNSPELVDKFLPERQAVIHAIAWWLLAQQGTGQHRIRGYQEIAAQYFLGGKSLDRVRQMLKMDMNKVSEKRKQCEDLLKDMDRRAHAIIDEKLVNSGIIQGEWA